MRVEEAVFGNGSVALDLHDHVLHANVHPLGLEMLLYVDVTPKRVAAVRGLCGWVDVGVGQSWISRVAWVAPVVGGVASSTDAKAQERLAWILDHRVIDEIDRLRLLQGGDVSFRLWLMIEAVRAGNSERVVAVPTFNVARSRWSDVLNKAGYGTVYHNRFPPMALGDAFADVVRHMRAGEKTLDVAPDAAVASYRSAADRFTAVAGLGTKFDRNAFEGLLRSVVKDPEVRDGMMENIVALRRLLNRGPHPTSTGFTALEARHAANLTAATLSFLSECLLLQRAGS